LSFACSTIVRRAPDERLSRLSRALKELEALLAPYVNNGAALPETIR
jgi:hypothetical protein